MSFVRLFRPDVTEFLHYEVTSGNQQKNPPSSRPVPRRLNRAHEISWWPTRKTRATNSRKSSRTQHTSVRRVVRRSVCSRRTTTFVYQTHCVCGWVASIEPNLREYVRTRGIRIRIGKRVFTTRARSLGRRCQGLPPPRGWFFPDSRDPRLPCAEHFFGRGP